MSKENGSKGRRKANWTTAEVAFLAEKYERHSKILDAPLNNNITNSAKMEIWRKMEKELANLEPGKGRTVDEIREKLGKIKSEARRLSSELKKEQKRTGGGPSTIIIPPSYKKIMDINENAPSFHGIIGGIDSERKSPETFWTSMNSVIGNRLNRTFSSSPLVLEPSPMLRSRLKINTPSSSVGFDIETTNCSNRKSKGPIFSPSMVQVDVKPKSNHKRASTAQTSHLHAEVLALEKKKIVAETEKIKEEIALIKLKKAYYSAKMNKF